LREGKWRSSNVLPEGMMTSTWKVRQLYLIVMASLAWLSVISTIVWLFRVDRTVINAVNYISSVTILLVAIVATASALRSSSDTFLTRPSTMSGVAVYVFYLGLMYLATGLASWKGAVPILYVVYWLLFVPKGTLTWKQPFYWLIYPILYWGFEYWRGGLIFQYLGHDSFAIFIVFVVSIFLLGMIAFAIDRLIGLLNRRPIPHVAKVLE
jgi:hypothetical protein